ncbi:10144_t:CDS:10 [Acaulospora colombiana]|uniref:10144_t:CDS:1 n=1 Tax=Acaulospora colombiana TaxID=27376 RepID=A0ACA9LMY3_9GLOM|nr:10144_t:CDS:10 [Acaulospora colombiana]
MTFEVGKPPPKIDPEILNNMKMIDFVGYAPNPGHQKRNQEPLSLFEDEAELDATSTRMPKYYRRVEIMYSRFGVDDFDFDTIPQASALELFEPEEPDEKTAYSLLIQNFNRFILEQLHQECNSDNNPRLLKSLPLEQTSLSMVQQLFGMQVVSINLCQCETKTERHTIPFVVDLNYYANNSKGKGSAVKSFVEVLRSCIQRETQPKAWCNKCRKYVPTIAKRIPKGLPPILSINCGLGTTAPAEFWRSPDGNKSWLAKRISMSINQDDLNIEEIAACASIDVNHTGNSNYANYELTVVIENERQVKPEKEISHLVAFVKVSKEELESSSKGPWYLFNDFLVKNVNEQEVFNFQGPWKTPVLLYYSRVDISDLMDTSALPSEIDKSILFKEISISNANVKSVHLLTPEELPQPGTLVAIDAEFVALNQEETEIRSDGTKSVIRPRRLSLARVSVLRGEGAKENLPFIDDYIATSEPVVDYLTEFSGIEAWYLLRQDIQTDTHDSIEDARTALAVYKKYLQFKSEGIFEEVLEDIYDEGRKCNWKPTPGMFPTMKIGSAPTPPTTNPLDDNGNSPGLSADGDNDNLE